MNSATRVEESPLQLSLFANFAVEALSWSTVLKLTIKEAKQSRPSEISRSEILMVDKKLFNS